RRGQEGDLAQCVVCIRTHFRCCSIVSPCGNWVSLRDASARNSSIAVRHAAFYWPGQAKESGMQGRSTLFVLGVVLAVVGCIGHRGGSRGGGGVSPITGSYHIVVSVQPASPQVDQPIAIQVQVLNGLNQPAAVTTNASVSISATPLGFSPRTL